MNKKKKLQILSLGASLMMICGIVGLNVDSNKKTNETEATVIEEVVSEEPTRIIYEPHYYNDTVDVDSTINSLGIRKDDSYPYDSYRYIRFVDNDSYERFAIVIGYVDYKTEDGKIIDTFYHYYNVFTGEYMFSTRETKNINNSNIRSDIIKYLMDYGKLLDLRDCVISKGLDSSYAYSVIGEDIKNKMLNTYEVARIYVLLVNSSNRYENSNQMTIG